MQNMRVDEQKPILESHKTTDVPESEEEQEINDALDQTFGLGTILFLIPPHLFYMFYGCEGVLLSIVGLVLKCKWNLSGFTTSLIQMEVIVVGALSCFAVSGFIDRFGRKTVLLVTFTGVIVSGILSGLFDNVWVFAAIRFVMGLFIGPGVGTAIALIPELPPQRYRSYAVAMCSLSGALGTIISCIVCYFFLNSLGWRRTIIIVPGIFLLILPTMILSRESMRWDVVNGNMKSADKSIKLLYRLNGSTFKGRLKEYNTPIEGDKKESTSFKWFIQERRRIVDLVVVLILAFSTGFMFWVSVFAGPRFIIAYSGESGSIIANNTVGKCYIADEALFRNMISVVPESLVSFIGAFGTNKFGRRRFAIFVGMAQVLAMTLFYIPLKDSNAWTLMVMVMRCTGSLSNTIAVLVISEYFPTNVRSSAEHLGLMATKIAGCLAAIASQYLFDISINLFVTVLLIVAVITFIDSFLLKETLDNDNIDVVR